jgi:ribosomal peptide maturation radical SAM protein 1
MYQVALVNMPFAAVDIPSLALTQLKSIVARELGDRVHCDTFYLNLDLVELLGFQLYQAISDSVQANTAGLGDWFFSEAAFPELPDRTEQYLARHFSEQRAELAAFKPQLLAKRRAAGAFLTSLVDRYHLADYDLVGLTSMFSQNLACFAMARALRRRSGVRVVMGGANCEAPMGAVIASQVPAVDFVFSGPALKSFPALLRCLLAGDEEGCHAIHGVLSRRKLAGVPPGRCLEIGEELDIDEEIPLDYDEYLALLDGKLHGQPLVPKIPFETSRGCWWGERSHCTFCGLNGTTMTYRSMQPRVALATLHQLFARYASRAVEFESVDNILPREYLRDVLPQLETPEGVTLFYEVKADLKEWEMEVLAKARVTNIQPGIEALSTQTLKLMKKGTTSFQNLKFLMSCIYHGVSPQWNLLVGFPGEPESVYEKYWRDLPRLVHLQPPSGVYPVRFDRYSPYHKLAQEYGLKLRPCEFYEMIYPFPPEELEALAYFFRDEDAAAPYAVNTARWLGRLRERVAYWQRRWQQRDSGLKPELLWKQGAGGWVIFDSRSGRAVEHRIASRGMRILHALGSQQKLPRLLERLGGGIPEGELAAEVKSLVDRGFLFEEDGTYLSLVMRPKGDQRLPFEEAPAVAAERAAAAPLAG